MLEDLQSDFRVTWRELVWINNCLNELLTSDEIQSYEYGLRIGGRKEEIEALLQRVGACLTAGQTNSG